MESIAFKEEEKEGGGERKQVKGKTALLSYILFFFKHKGQGRSQAAGGSKEQHYHLPVRKKTLDPTTANENLAFLRSSTHRPSEKGCGSQAA